MAKITNTGVFIVEGSAAAADVAGSSQIWVKSDTPSSLYHTDDAGNDLRMGGWMVSAEQSPTSGTSVDFTGIPSGVRNIKILFDAISLNGSEDLELELGDSGGIETSGYVSMAENGNTRTANTTSLQISSSGDASHAYTGQINLALEDVTNNTWCSFGILRHNDSNISLSGGSKTLSATLDRLRIKSSGSNTFDAGSLSIMYQ
tara:strand:- start:114 stop:722 length:609 start_codon:yes stop_codon:yes gene_type:complete